MDSVLTAQWLAGLRAVPIYDVASVALLQTDVREQATRLGLSNVVSGSLVNIASELGHNQLAHARAGSIALRPIVREDTPGLEIVAADAGEGIADPAGALAGSSRRLEVGAGRKPQSLGIGLAAVLELADEVDFDIRRGEGTCVWARKFARPVPRRRQVGIFGRPCPGEHVSGDQALFVRDDRSLLLAVIDGLGHGPFARSAADIAQSVIAERTGASLDAMLADVHAELQKSRGAVLTLARVEEPEGGLDAAAVGNVMLQVWGLDNTWRISGASWVLGTPGPRRSPARKQHQVGARDAVALFSDGVSSRLDTSREPELLREHPIIAAQRIADGFARDNDDALVLVAR